MAGLFSILSEGRVQCQIQPDLIKGIHIERRPSLRLPTKRAKHRAPANVNFLAISEMEDVTLKLDHWVGEELK